MVMMGEQRQLTSTQAGTANESAFGVYELDLRSTEIYHPCVSDCRRGHLMGLEWVSERHPGGGYRDSRESPPPV